MLSHRIQSRHYYSSNLLFVHWPRNTPAKKWNPFKLENSNAERGECECEGSQKFAPERRKMCRVRVGKAGAGVLVEIRSFSFRHSSPTHAAKVCLQTANYSKFTPLTTPPHHTDSQSGKRTYSERVAHISAAMVSAMLMNFFLVSFVLAIAVKIGVEKCVRENLKTKTPGNVAGKWHGMGEYWFCLDIFMSQQSITLTQIGNGARRLGADGTCNHFRLAFRDDLGYRWGHLIVVSVVVQVPTIFYDSKLLVVRLVAVLEVGRGRGNVFVIVRCLVILVEF